MLRSLKKEEPDNADEKKVKADSLVDSTHQLDLKFTRFDYQSTSGEENLPWYKGLLYDTKDLFRNPLFLMQVIGGLVHSWAMAVKSTFGQKYLEIQFDLTASEASKLKTFYIMTLCLGFFLGGLVVKLGKLRALGVVRFLTFNSLLSTIVSLSLWPRFHFKQNINFKPLRLRSGIFKV